MTSTAAKSPKLLELPLSSPPPQHDEGQIGVGSSLTPETVLEQVLSGVVSHVVQRDGVAFETEVKFAELMSTEPQTFMDFPISSILTPQLASAEQEILMTQLRVKCSSWADRYTATDQVVQGLTGKTNDGLLSDVRTATLELISNALLHGPRDEFEQIKYSKEGQEFHNALPIHIKPSFLTVGRDEERIVIACRDLYGGLDVHALLQRVHRCFEYGVSVMLNHGEGGAGVGSFFLFKLALAAYIGVTPGGQTVFCITFPMRGGLRLRHAIPKNLHTHIFAGAK